jgi:hypothetical protein
MSKLYKIPLVLVVIVALLPLNRSYGSYYFAPQKDSQAIRSGANARYVFGILNREADDDTMNLLMPMQFNIAWSETLFFDTLGTYPLANAPDINRDGTKGDILVPAQAFPPDYAFFSIRVYAPDTALAYTLDTVWVMGRGKLDQQFLDTAWVLTSILPDPKVQLAVDSTDSILAGDYIDYPLTITNQGNFPDTIDLTYLNGLETQGWTVRLLDSTGTNTIPDNNGDGFPDVDSLTAFSGQAKIIARIQSTATSVAGTVDSVLVICSTNFAKGMKDTVLLVTTIKTVGQLSIGPNAADSTFGGQSITYPLIITNNGSAPDIVDLQTTFSLPTAPWSRTLLDTTGAAVQDNNGNGYPDVGPVPPHGGQLRFTVRVTPVSNAIAGTIDTTKVTAMSTIPGVSVSAFLMTTLRTQTQVAVAPDSADSCEAGQSIRYPLEVINGGNGPDYVNIQLRKGHAAWPMTVFAANGTTPLADNNGDGLIDVGRINGFGADTAQIWVELRPPAATPESTFDTSRIVASSAIRPATNDSAAFVTMVYVVFVAQAGIEIGPATQTDTTKPDTPIDYQLWVRNTGNAEDTVELSTTGIWTDTLLNSNDGPLAYRNSIPYLAIASGDTGWFKVRITPPNNFGAANQITLESRTVVARSSIENTLTDTALVVTKVVPGLTVYNYPNPFPTQTTFYFSLPEPGKVNLKIFDQVGAFIATLIDKKDYETGAYLLPWNSSNWSGKRIAPGVYIWVFDFDGTTLKKQFVKKAVLSQ